MALGDDVLGTTSLGSLVKLTKRTKTAGQVALSMWRLIDGSPFVAKITQAQHDAWGGIGDAPGRPAADATFLMACGGIVALDTADGYPSKGDAWEDTDPALGNILRIATSNDFNWAYRQAIASDPGQGSTSQLTGFAIESSGQRARLQIFDPQNLPDFDTDVVPKKIAVSLIDEVIPNTRSVTFDATATGNGTGTTLTVAGTVATQTDRYIAAIAAYPLFGNPLTGVAWNGDGLTERLSLTHASGPEKEVSYWDMVAPDQGSFNLVFTFGSSNDCQGGFVSCYGVDQTTPRSATATDTGTGTAPTLDFTSASGELIISAMGHGGADQTNTDDPDWTTDWNTITSWDPVCGVAHIAGAASVNRTDTLSASAFWMMLGASIKAAAAGGAAAGFGPLLGGQRNRHVLHARA